MSDLQLSLLAIGVVVVAAVYLYNGWQERRLKRRLQEAFGAERDDALMKPQPVAARVEPQVRMEPQFQSASVQETDDDVPPAAVASVEASAHVQTVADAPLPEVPWFDEMLDYVVELQAPAPLGAAAVAELLSKVSAAGRLCRAAGYDAQAGEWRVVSRSTPGRHTRLRLAVQLVTRNGPIPAPQLAAFIDAVRASAAKLGAAADAPDSAEALERAKQIDAYCAEVDVAIGLNVIAPAGRSFSGTDIRTHAEAAGFKLEPDGLFHYLGEDHETLFTLDNHEPLPFLPEQIKSVTTAGVTLLLDVPRVVDGRRAFDAMAEAARALATALGGSLVDDNRVALNATGIAKIREQLDTIAASMAQHGIPPGGERALRLFS